MEFKDKARLKQFTKRSRMDRSHSGIQKAIPAHLRCQELFDTKEQLLIKMCFEFRTLRNYFFPEQRLKLGPLQVLDRSEEVFITLNETMTIQTSCTKLLYITPI